MEFGIDWNGPSILQDDTASVSVPNVICPLEPEELSVLQSHFDPHEPNIADLGVELYISVRRFVHFCINSR